MQYTLINPKPLGDNDPKYGQTWWSDSHDSDKPLMFNLMTGEVGDGAVISFEESVNKQSAKGTDYLRLRKVKVESPGAANGPVMTRSGDSGKLLELIYSDTQKILQLVDNGTPQTLSEAWQETNKPAKDTVVEDIGEEPMNLSDIPF